MKDPDLLYELRHISTANPLRTTNICLEAADRIEQLLRIVNEYKVATAALDNLYSSKKQ